MEMLLLPSDRNSKAPNRQEEGIMRIGIITLTLSTALLFSTAGFADDNTADLDQSGNDNLISVTQVGDSSVSITQNGDHNIVTIDQHRADAMVVQQDSSQATATISQENSQGWQDWVPFHLLQVNSTNVTVDITFTGRSSQLFLHQEGSNLQFEAVDNGENFHIYAMDGGRGQFGSNNSALITQRGWIDDGNDVTFRQDGESNRVELTQTSYQSWLTVDQSGELNTIFVQDDGHTWTTINQTGTSNLINLSMAGDVEITFNQSGEFNTLSGSLSSTSIYQPIQQSGIQNLMVLDINNRWGDTVGENILTQTGDNGIMLLTQDGIALTAALTQLGSGNSMNINQTGTSNHVEVTQN
ncbi:hypothetical protein DJ031_16085 [bacterium endosymbiont of Escarpia laminata]|nr:MAG: hypothetical protein DJ031_16085 [bacterium endosymbiont of Escarpia laminata]